MSDNYTARLRWLLAEVVSYTADRIGLYIYIQNPGATLCQYCSFFQSSLVPLLELCRLKVMVGGLHSEAMALF
jgi:hypothetical protein